MTPRMPLSAVSHHDLPHRLRMSETQRFLLLAILIGVYAGLLIVCFHISIELLNWFSIGAISQRLRFGRLLLPSAGALVSSLVVLKVFRAAQGSGVNQTKAALYVSDGYVPFSTVIGKFLACSISIGSGNSLGPEDPALQMGAGVASLLGRLFHLPRDNMRLIAPVGAAAGIAAAFNTPITGVLFVMEEVVAAWNAGVVGSVVLAAVAAVVVVRLFLGNEPLFQVPTFAVVHPSELLVYAALGIAGGLLSALFVSLIRRLRECLDRLPPWTTYLQPVTAGLLVGTAGLWLPQVMGAGYDAVDNALHGQFTWNMLLLLGIVKMFVTLFCFSSGTPGGMFAPTLFVGAMIGGGLAGLATRYGPFPAVPVGAYVLVGMGAFFAGMFRAPMTSIFMVFELSASYAVILPVMIANTIAYFVSRKVQPVPFFTMLARQEGVDLPSAEERRSVPVMRVEEAMQPAPELVLHAEITLAEARDRMKASRLTVCPVRRDDGQCSWISRDSLDKAVESGDGDRVLRQAVNLEPVPRLYPDLPVDSALRLLATHPLLPVASRTNPDRLVGVLSLSDVHRAYGIRDGAC